MNLDNLCASAAEHVSTLCDGEIIPPDAAEHIATCPDCQSRLRDYLALGVELRRAASLEIATAPPAPLRTWTRSQNRLTTLWQKGWTTMRIPRLAFAALIAGIVVLASSLTWIKVRAQNTGTVVLLSVNTGYAKPMECALSTVDKNNTCGFMGQINKETLSFRVELLARSTDRVHLSFRALAGNHQMNEIASAPQQLYWFEPGDTLKVDMPGGIAPLTITGNWLDHMPAWPYATSFDPGPDELRIVSPMLVRDKDVVGDMEGASGSPDKPDQAVWIYFPGQGAWLLSLSPLQGAIQTNVRLNRLAFEENGQHYQFVTASPITRADHIWVLHDTSFKPTAEDSHGFLGMRGLVQVQPNLWAPRDMPQE